MGDVLFLGHRIPYPPDRGDKIRGYHILKHLSERHRVHLVAFADDARDEAAQHGLAAHVGAVSVLRRTKHRMRAVVEALASGQPASITAFADKRMRRAVAAMLDAHPIDTIYVFSSQMAQYVPAATRATVVMDFVDVDSAKFAAYAQGSTGLRGWLFAREGRTLLAHDRAVAARVDASLFVSAEEAEIFRRTSGVGRVHVVENGIDTEVYDPAAHYGRVEESGPLVVFTGQMDYRPNIEGVAWFAHDVLPEVRARHPAARFAIVGRAPAAEVLALAKLPGVLVTGEVADVRGWLAAADAVVAPLKLARGIQNKVLEAMAMARPVVASTAAAEGIDHVGTVRVGGTAAELAAHVVALLDDPASAASLGMQARRRVQARYGWEAALAPLDTLLGDDAGRRNAA